MSDPLDCAHIKEEEIVQGTLRKILFVVQDADKAAIDLTSAGRTAWLTMTPTGGGTTITRTTATAANREWETDGTDGQVRWVFLSADSIDFAEGEYNVEVWFSDTNVDPSDQKRKGEGVWRVIAP